MAEDTSRRTSAGAGANATHVDASGTPMPGGTRGARAAQAASAAGQASAPTPAAPLASARVVRHPRAASVWTLAVCLAALSLGTFAAISAGTGARSGGDPASVIEMSAPAAQIETNPQPAGTDADSADASASADASDATAQHVSTSPTAPATQTPLTPQDVEGAGFAVSDASQVWQDETSVELFSNSCINAAGTTTVAAADGRKVIAPGTSGAYTFALRNTGTTPLTYRVWVEVTQDAGSLVIPLDVRLTKGAQLTRTVDEAAAGALPGLADSGALETHANALYTLSWIWPFDEDDARDTALGQAAAGRDLTCTVTIHARAEATPGAGDEPGSNGAGAGVGGQGVPKTGDLTISAWPLAAGGAALVLAGAGMGSLAARHRRTHGTDSPEERR